MWNFCTKEWISLMRNRNSKARCAPEEYPAARSSQCNCNRARTFREKFRNTKAWRVFCVVFSIAFVLAGWHITALLLNTPALPTPPAAVSVFLQFAPEIAPSVQISFLRLFASLLIGTLLGVPAGLILGRSRVLGDLFTPALYILYPLPKIVLLPILLVLMGLGGAPKIALISITVFFQVVLVMRDAARNVPTTTVEAALSMGVTRTQLIARVILPDTLPQLFTTLRVSSAVAIAVLFFAEAIAGSTGVGYFIMNAWSMVNYARMFAGIIALALLGVVFYAAFDVAERKFKH